MTEQEVKPCRFVGGYCTHCEATERGDCQGWVSSTKREWVGLTDEERNKLWRDVIKWGDPSHDDVDLMKAIEVKLKERNT
jgi:hypothetical protein